MKVQYPGVAEAVEMDLRNLQLILRLVKRMAPGLDVKAVGGEIRERISEELDYELEAQNHRPLERAFGGHPFAVVPNVHPGLGAPRPGQRIPRGVRFEAVKEMDEAARDSFGETVFRFFFARERTLMILGDPHPGNYLLLGDGRVGFLDRLSRPGPGRAHGARASPRPGDRGPAGRRRARPRLEELGYLPGGGSSTPTPCSTRSGPAARVVLGERLPAADPGYARELIEIGGSPKSPHYEQMKRQTLPPCVALIHSQEGLVFITLADLRAGADWAAIGAEYFAGAAPTTELGEAEREFWQLSA